MTVRGDLHPEDRRQFRLRLARAIEHVERTYDEVKNIADDFGQDEEYDSAFRTRHARFCLLNASRSLGEARRRL